MYVFKYFYLNMYVFQIFNKIMMFSNTVWIDSVNPTEPKNNTDL